MTKQEKIKEAWGRFWNPEIHHYSINGWSDPEHYSEEEMYEMMQEIDMEFGEFRCRPKSLQGIEGFVECEFCNWNGNKEDLLPNFHCPKCQSPSTRKNLTAYECYQLKKNKLVSDMEYKELLIKNGIIINKNKS